MSLDYLRRPIGVAALPPRLAPLEDARNVLPPAEQERCLAEFRRWLEQCGRLGASLTGSETRLLWLGWLASRQAERLHQRVEAARRVRDEADYS